MNVDAHVVAAAECTYLPRLESNIVSLLAERRRLSSDEAMSLFYNSKLAKAIEQGAYGIQYMSPSYLVDDLIRNEPELFE